MKSKNTSNAVADDSRSIILQCALANRLVDHCIRIPSDQTQCIQEAHILSGHILCKLIAEALLEQN